ncbi:MAG: glycosyltransferase family A protein [Bauldia sp.]
MDRLAQYAIVTAYYKEDEATIRRCITSVAAQGASCEHFLVADGHPQAWLASQAIRHIVLDRAHGDFGNTPRGVGALLAICEGFDGFCFLDADNWLEPSHLADCIAAASSIEDCDLVRTGRTFRRPDGSLLPVAEDRDSDFTDTNCFFFLPGSYHLTHHFAIAPREFAPIGDRIFSRALKRANLREAAVGHATVNYSCGWASAYHALGETPPDGAKPNIDASPIWGWLATRDRRELEIISRRSGVKLPE